MRPLTAYAPSAQQERALGEQRRERREPALQERLAEPVHAAGVARELLVGEVGGVVDLQQLALTARAPLDPAVDLRCRCAPPVR